jgi:hypothetical protein
MRQGSDQTMRTDYPLVYAQENMPNVQVVRVDGRAVATAPVLPRRVIGEGVDVGMGVISPTATDPTHQHHGYGSACVAGCVARMEAAGLPLSVLWTAVATFPFYELNGWQAVERYGAWYPLGAADAGRFRGWPGHIERLEDRPDLLGSVLALHDAAGDRVERTPHQASALFSLPKMTTWLAFGRDLRLAGYLLESRATNKPGVLESGGEPAAIEGLLRSVLERLPEGASIDMQVRFAPDPLAAIAAERLADRSPTPYDGNMMLRLNDPLAFLRGIRGWLAARRPDAAPSISIRVPDAGQTVSLAWRAFGVSIGEDTLPEHVELSRRDLTSVVFGSHPDRPVEVPEPLRWWPRFHVPIPVLDRS